MPYYIVEDGQEPYDGQMPVYGTRLEAHQALKIQDSRTWQTLTVAYRATEEDESIWRERERCRCRHGRAKPVPWAELPRQIDLDQHHYAYMSPLVSGLVAYTPSVEWGVQDRQLRVTPGKYLTQHHSDMCRSDVDHWCAVVKAESDRYVLRYARTAEEIVAVYLRGPSSCMSHSVSDFRKNTGRDLHPTAIYGDSDLAVAYLGDPTDHVTARCVVWPDRWVYTRVYGDETLTLLLQQAGYFAGNLTGARIQRIRAPRGGFIMPYVDGATCAVDDGQTLRLQMSEPTRTQQEEGSVYTTRELNGTTEPPDEDEDDPETYSCMNPDCGEEVEEDGDYCPSCLDAHYICQSCERELFFFDTEPFRTPKREKVLCSQCRRDLAETCARCDETFYPSVDYVASTQQQRDRQDVTEYCENCVDAVLARRAEPTLLPSPTEAPS